MFQGNLVFHVGGREMVRIEANGDFFVEGRKAGTDVEVFDGFRKFIAAVHGEEPLSFDDGTRRSSWARILEDE